MAIAVLVPTIGRGPQFTTDQYMRARHPIGISDPAIGRLHIARVTDARPSPADRPAIPDHPVAVMVGLLATLGRQERAQGLPEMAAVLLDPRPHPDPLRFSDLRRRQDQLQFSGPRPR